MSSNWLDVITLCDHEMCPTIKSNNGAIAMIVVKSDGESHPVDNRRCHRFESHKNRAIGDAHR